MKKLFNLALFGAIALTGAVGISSCSSSNDEVINYSDYNPEVDAVKTQFTISLPSNVAGTRQSAATVQADQNNTSFRGFDNMVLIPYAEVTTGTDVNVSGNRLISKSITLTPTGGTANTLPKSSLATGNNSYVYSDVTIPFGTKGFLFYGKAIDGTGDNFENGSLTAAPSGLSGENTGFSFSLVPTKSSGEGAATNLLAYINAIAATTTTTNPATSWYSTTNTGLKGLYDKFITIKAGSSTSVSAALEDLYESLKDNTDDLSKAICSNILASGTTYTSANAEGKRITLGSSMNNYPGEINLPDGAVGLVWTNSTHATASATAAWLGSSNAGENTWNTGSTFTSLENYVYPASLYYRADSPIKVSNSKQSDNYSGKSWTGETNSVLALYTNGNAVSPSTQSVALVEQIQYAVARLKSTIGIESTTLKDRVGSDIKIGTSATDDGTLKVTGILIGGQQNVDWQFHPTASTYYTIYDKAIPSESDANVIKAALSGSSPSYSGGVENNTLALETPEGTPVHIAIEFENNAKDFMGVDGMIAKGTKFYLVAELNPATTGGNATNPSSSLTQVFKQDYVTTGIFKVNENTTADSGTSIYPKGLGAAYNVIPDLRTPKLELGLSVDLTWQSGLQFEISM